MTDVAAWLKELGLEHYERAFRESEITAAVLPELTDADLKELGLPLGPRKLLLKAIASLPRGAAAEPVPRPATTLREAERRQLSVMFVDLVASTELAAGLDPEDMGQVIRAYQGACTDVVERWGGHVAKYMGTACSPISAGRRRTSRRWSARRPTSRRDCRRSPRRAVW